MKVREQPIHRLEAVRRIDEDVRVTLALVQHAVGGRCALQRAEAGRADGPDMSPGGPHAVHLRRRVPRYLIPLAVHVVLARVVYRDGPERAGADMQQDVSPFHAFPCECLQHVGGEVQSRGRRSGRSRLARVHGLVPVQVCRRIGTCHVGWQRYVAVSLDRLGRRHVGMQPYEPRALRGGLQHLDTEAGRDRDHLACLQLGAGLHHCLPHVTATVLEQQHFGWCAGRPLPQQPSAHHLCRVHDEGVASRNDVHDVTKAMMCCGAAAAIHHQQPALVAAGRRGLRDERFGQFERIIGDAAAVGACTLLHEPR